jgi:hypothetical protein
MVREEGEWRVLRSGPMLSDVRVIAPGPAGDIWFGFGDSAFHAAGGGLARFDGASWSYEDPLGLGGRSNVRALAVGRDGALWAGAGCNLVRRDTAGWEVLVGCEELAGNVIRILPQDDQDVVFATETGVYHLVEDSLEKHEGRVVLATAVGPDGDLWVAQSPLSGSGLVRFDGTTWVTETLPIGVVTSLAVVPDDGILAAGEGRVFRRADDGTWAAVGDADVGITQLYVGPEGGVWGLALQRVLHLSEDRWVTVFDAAPLAVNTFAVTEGRSLWLGTPAGAVHIGARQ